MNLSTFIARGRKALRIPPRKLMARLAEEAEQQTRRPWASVYPRLLRDSMLFGSSGARNYDQLWDALKSSPFFLHASDRAAYAEAFRTCYPDEVDTVIATADAAVRHEFDLLGSGPKQFGPKLPWLDDFKTGRHYPIQYCRDIQYMELDKPTDVKVPWELSRCQHFTALGQAYWLTGDERYAQEYRAQIEDWIAVNPFAYSVNWACPMDVALRAINWIWGFHFLADSAACRDPRFRRDMLRSLFTHGEFVIKHLERGDVNGNHYLSDAAGLVFLGVFFRHTPQGRRWLATGRAIVLHEMPLQVSADGVDHEQSTSYQRLVLELFLTSYLLLERSGDSLPQLQLDRLASMLEFVAAYTKPNGLTPLIGDADDGRVQKLGHQRLNDHRYLLSTGAVRFGRGDLKHAAAAFWSESFWMLGPAAADRFDGLQAVEKVESKAFAEGGFYVLRNAAAHMVIDCGEVGMRGRGGHGHNDITSFELFLNGINVVSDCGAYLYTASREWRNKFRSTAFHNVVQVEDEELNRFIGPDALWQLSYDAHPIAARWVSDGAGGYLGCAHDGYARLTPPVELSREFYLDPVQPRAAVRDVLRSAAPRATTWRLHFDPGAGVEVIEQDCRIQADGREVWVLAGDPADRRTRTLERGWVSESYGVRRETSVLVITDTVMPATFSCVFAEARLSAGDRRRILEQLDAHGAHRGKDN
ncbi:MAG TPA: alginate lyase family protein [Vicinamibacterales bacterium]|nr:alginate lyase family protein [Vicinamibacterales bacterium]